VADGFRHQALSVNKRFETLHRFKLKSSVRAWLGALLDSLLPRRCLVSRLAGDDGRDLCAAWYHHLPRPGPLCARCANPVPKGHQEPDCAVCQTHPPAFDAVQTGFLYEFPVDMLVQRFKFDGRLEAGALLAGLLAETLVGLPLPDALIPVPLHRDRLAERGFDQALMLAGDLGRALKLPVCANRLTRVRATPAQSGLNRKQRRRNLQRAFVATGPLPPHLALIDDVLTTGSTAQACAAVLKGAGARRVDVWVVARA